MLGSPNQLKCVANSKYSLPFCYKYLIHNHFLKQLQVTKKIFQQQNFLNAISDTFQTVKKNQLFKSEILKQKIF